MSVELEIDFDGNPHGNGQTIPHCGLETVLHDSFEGFLVEVGVQALEYLRIARLAVGANN